MQWTLREATHDVACLLLLPRETCRHFFSRRRASSSAKDDLRARAFQIGLCLKRKHTWTSLQLSFASSPSFPPPSSGINTQLNFDMPRLTNMSCFFRLNQDARGTRASVALQRRRLRNECLHTSLRCIRRSRRRHRDRVSFGRSEIQFHLSLSLMFFHEPVPIFWQMKGTGS